MWTIRRAATPARMIGTSRSVNEPLSSGFALFCNPESRRVEGFSIALGQTLRQRPKLIPWQWVLEGADWRNQFDEAPQILRLESPGRNWRVERQFLLQGATTADEEGEFVWGKMS